MPAPDVTVVRWPDEAERLDRLRKEGIPRLVLVAPDALPPESTACEEDWIRLPAGDPDVRARLASLAERSARHGHGHAPEIDLAGRLRFMGRWVALSTSEQRIARALVKEAGAVVGYDTLSRRGWPDDDKDHGNQLRVQILRLRRRLEPLGLSIRTVNGRGYVLEPR
jgi:DNA-binding response OmpR family regulator